MGGLAFAGINANGEISPSFSAVIFVGALRQVCMVWYYICMRADGFPPTSPVYGGMVLHHIT